MWTQFWDMHSGGGQKLDYNMIYIEAPLEEAVKIFENKFDRDPYNVTCNCCGEDYSIEQYESIEDATQYHRRIKWDSPILISLEEYKQNSNAKFIYKEDL